MNSTALVSLKKPEAILFDWDNTLVDSWPIIFDALNFTLQTFAKEPWSMAQVKNQVRKSLRDSFPELFGDQWEQAAKVFYGHFDDIHIARLSPFDGAAKMLQDLFEHGVYLAVVSNKRGQSLRKEASHLGWDKYFSKLVGAMDAGNDKPSKDPVELALGGCPHKSGGQVWFVGDADIDMQCAINADLAPVLLRPEAPRRDEFNAYQPLLHLQSCQALFKSVENM